MREGDVSLGGVPRYVHKIRRDNNALDGFPETAYPLPEHVAVLNVPCKRQKACEKESRAVERLRPAAAPHHEGTGYGAYLVWVPAASGHSQQKAERTWCQKSHLFAP